MSAFLPLLAVCCFVCGFGFFAYRRGLVYLHFFQQEEYDGTRFIPWLVRHMAFDRTGSVIVGITGAVALASPTLNPLAVATGGIALAGAAHTMHDPRRTGKKKLVLTARAQRVLMAYGALVVALLGGLLAVNWPLVGYVVAIQALPLVLVAGNGLLMPLERRTQARLMQEARDKLAALKPVVVGVSGAFGKTSTKHMLTHILASHAPALMTPGSINTPMGITRVIREQLGPHHRVFVCEMGAYRKGSIAGICDFVEPQMGILVSLGNAHLERFGSLEAIAEAEGELPAYVLARGGKAFMGPTTRGYAFTRQLIERAPKGLATIGTLPTDTIRMVSCTQTVTGLEVVVELEGTAYTLAAPLFGLHHGTNMALAFAAAVALGVPAERAAEALKSVPQTRHRLEVLPQSNGSVLIDDAYNSNPDGFRAALDILDMLGHQKGGRRILVSPGMVELGAEHNEAHAAIGGYAAQKADVFLAVVPDRIASMVAAFTAQAPQATYVPCADFATAQAWLAREVRAGDVVLLENDLPDLYETQVRF